jgi:hypothetical protein
MPSRFNTWMVTPPIHFFLSIFLLVYEQSSCILFRARPFSRIPVQDSFHLIKGYINIPGGILPEHHSLTNKQCLIGNSPRCCMHGIFVFLVTVSSYYPLDPSYIFRASTFLPFLSVRRMCITPSDPSWPGRKSALCSSLNLYFEEALKFTSALFFEL